MLKHSKHDWRDLPSVNVILYDGEGWTRDNPGQSTLCIWIINEQWEIMRAHEVTPQPLALTNRPWSGDSLRGTWWLRWNARNLSTGVVLSSWPNQSHQQHARTIYSIYPSIKPKKIKSNLIKTYQNNSKWNLVYSIYSSRAHVQGPWSLSSAPWVPWGEAPAKPPGVSGAGRSTGPIYAGFLLLGQVEHIKIMDC